MQLTILTSLALFVASAIAQNSGANPFNIPKGGYALTAGQPSTITWKPTTSGPVTLTLRDGASSDLNKGIIIAQSISNSGSFTYTPPSNTVRNSDYTIEIASDSDSSAINYTPQFVIESSNTVASISAASSSGGASSITAASSAASASASASVASSTSASNSIASTASASASSSSASASASASASSSSSKGTSTASSSSKGASASSSGSSTTASVEKAPSSGANVRNVVHGGLAAVAMGAALVL